MERCGAKRRQGGAPCRKPAGWGTPQNTGPCRLHLGNTPSHLRAAEIEQARRACQSLGVSVAIDPAEALLDELRRTYGAVLFFESLVAGLAHEPAKSPQTKSKNRKTPQRQAPAAIYEPIYHASGEATGEARPHVLIRLYNEERQHYARVAAAALQAGVAQRVIELAEGTARQVVEVMTDFARRLGLDPSAPEVREAGRAALQVVSGRS